jgi:hypothetical protein
MRADEFIGKRIAILLFVEKPGEADDVFWFAGEAREENGQLVFDRRDKAPFRLPSEAAEDIRACSDAQRDAFDGCEFVLPLTIKDLPAEGADGLEFTGLNIYE